MINFDHSITTAAEPARPGLRHQAGLGLMLAFGYALAAQAGMASAIGPSQITVIWPPSGLALAAFMLWGWQALPGLVLGAMWMNWHGFLSQVLGPTSAAFGGAVALTSASMLQAGLAAMLLRSMPQQLSGQQALATLRFSLTTALACLIAPTLGNLSLRQLGLLDQTELAYSWLIWWAGDFAGMLIVAPLLLLWRHPAFKGAVLAHLSFPLLCLGLGLSLITTFVIGHVERSARIERFTAFSTNLALDLQQRIELFQRDLDQLRTLYYKVDIDPDEFAAVARPLRLRSPWVRELAWLPRDRADRTAFAPALREPPPPVMLPRDHDDGNASIDPVFQTAVWRALATGQMSASAPFGGSEPGQVLVRLFVPALDPGVLGMGRHDEARVRGLVSITIDMARLLPASLEHDPDTPLIEARLIDPRAETGIAGIHLRTRGMAGPILGLDDGTLDVHLQERQLLQLAGRQWLLLSRPADLADWIRPSWLQIGVFTSGLAFTALLTAFMVARRRHDKLVRRAQAELEAEVALRTRELVHTNGKLQQEVLERRRAEGELVLARQNAESASQAKSMFLANMSHEIRTPLNAVIGYAQLLREDGRLHDQARERIGAILSAGRRLLGLINDVLDLSKIEAGGIRLQRAPFDLRREIEDVAQLLGPRIEAKGLQFDVQLDVPAHCHVDGDHTKVGQIVMNLMSNALKFTDHGRIGLRARWQQDRLELQIEDTGPGMTAEELAQLFVPFQQGQAGHVKGGTGLGLVLSRHLARLMEGDLTIASSPGQGSCATLTLRLPAVVQHLHDPGVAQDDIESLDPATPCDVLVIEDDPDSRAILVQVLARLGCQVRSAGNGEDGWTQIGTRMPDIVFSDIRMPVLDGLALLARLRGQAATARLPIVAVSASSLMHERRHFIEQGFTDFVGKPYELREIYRMLALHAGVRWTLRRPDAGTPQAAVEPAAAPAGTTGPDATPALDPARLRQLLQTLADAARDGEVQDVRAGLNQLAALQAMPAPMLQRLENCARQYDFDTLAEQADTLLTALPTAAETPPHPGEAT